MNSAPIVASDFSTSAVVADCWNKIGVQGDFSCPELKQCVHCRNCPVYSAAAVAMLDGALPADYLADWTRRVAEENQASTHDTQSVVVFRTGAEWLALPTTVFKEIVDVHPIHSLPHRRNGMVLGLVNIRGELLVCVSLRQSLRLDVAAKPDREKQAAANPRLLVMQYEGGRAVCPVDEVFGVHRLDPKDLMPVPATLARATTTYTKAILSWRQKSVGVLDEQLLFYTLNRGLALATTI